ncbi:MAG TPA: prevent-host-death protein [Chloroflexia bacterium]|nr:prevent-host-death protein [Chloroflexia bacterium]
MVQVSAEEAKTKLPDLIASAINGEAVFITQDGKQLVQLVPVEQSNRGPQFGSAKGLITIADDFDAPIEDFDEYMP